VETQRRILPRDRSSFDNEHQILFVAVIALKALQQSGAPFQFLRQAIGLEENYAD
jgi:hypothetical protein